MQHNKSFWLWLAMAASFFAVGLPFWFIPYHQINLPSALLHPGLFVVAAAALLVYAFNIASFWRSTLMVTLSVVVSELARVIVDVAIDSTTHNLLPFEIIITFMVGFPCALAGAAGGWCLAQIFPALRSRHSA
ncbi:MAG: hypothetical protein R3E67_06595 [Pseudomonadales bacterium]